MSDGVILTIKQRAEAAKQLLYDLTVEIEKIDQQISVLRADIEAVRSRPKALDEWISECLDYCRRVQQHSFSTLWLQNFVRLQKDGNWQIPGDRFNPLSPESLLNTGCRREVMEGALLHLVGPQVIESALRRLVAEHWPDGGLRQEEKDARIKALADQIDQLAQRRHELAQCLPVAGVE